MSLSRRHLLAAVGATGAAALFTEPVTADAATVFKVLSANHTGITVVNIEHSLKFWRDILGFPVVVRGEAAGKAGEDITGVPGADLEFAILSIPGGHAVELVQYRAPADRQHLRPLPDDVGSVHLALNVDDIRAVLRRARKAGWRAPGKPVTWNQAGSPFNGYSFVYMTDPDGTYVELIQAPM